MNGVVTALLQERYESCFLLVNGDIKKPLPLSKVPEFLEALLPSFPHDISKYNVLEVMELFGRHGIKSKELYWADLRKGLRDKQDSKSEVDSVFIRNALNPRSFVFAIWSRVVRGLAIYYFISVPIRLCFLPWDSMINSQALALDITMDAICVLNLAIQMNTAYMNSRAMWVTKRIKIMHKIPPGFFIAAIPLDWWVYM